MANTTREQFKTVIQAYEEHKNLDNDLCTIGMQEAVPSLKLTTVQVYRSNIENYVNSGLTGTSVSSKFVSELEAYYGTDDDEVKDDNMLTIIKDRDYWKAEADRLQQSIISMKNLLDSWGV